MTPEDLRAWQAELHLTHEAAAAALGVRRSTYTYWLAGTTRIPDMAGLACAALVAGLAPYCHARAEM